MRFCPMAVLSAVFLVSAALAVSGGHDALAQAAKDVKCKGCVNAKDLAKNAVSSSRLKNNAVSTSKLRNGAVSSGKIQGGAITDSKLAAGAVGSANLKDGAVTGAKLAPGLIGATFSLLDDNGDLVATVGDPGLIGNVSFLVEYPGFRPQRIAALLNDNNDDDPANDFYEIQRVGGTTARFTTNDCTGTVYLDPNDARSKTYFDYWQIGLVRGATGAGQARPLYAPLNATVLSLTIESTQVNNGACSNIAASVQDVIEMELVDPDLHATFPPPYRIVPN